LHFLYGALCWLQRRDSKKDNLSSEQISWSSEQCSENIEKLFDRLRSLGATQ
jgi:hypothetical protein